MRHVCLVGISVLMMIAACSSLRAAVTVQSAGTIGADADPHADTSVTLPAHATGDLFILMAFVRDADDTASITVASGWSACSGSFPVDRGTSARYWCWYKFATSASETNPTIDWSGTTGDAYWVVSSYRGVGSIGTVGTPTTGTSDPETHSTISTSVADAMVVLAEMGEDNNNGACTTTGTDPSAYTEHYSETTTGADAMTCFSDAIRSTAGASGTVSLDFDTAVPVGWGGVLITLNPPAAQVGDAAVSLANSPAVAVTTGRRGTAAASVTFSCPVCFDLSYPNSITAAMGISPAGTGIRGVPKAAAVSLGISPAETSVAAIHSAAAAALGISPAVSAFAPKTSLVDADLGISPAASTVLGLNVEVAAAMEIAPAVGEPSAGRDVPVDVALDISPDATGIATPAGGGGEVGAAPIAIAIAVSVTAVPHYRKRSVTVVFVS